MLLWSYNKINGKVCSKWKMWRVSLNSNTIINLTFRNHLIALNCTNFQLLRIDKNVINFIGVKWYHLVETSLIL